MARCGSSEVGELTERMERFRVQSRGDRRPFDERPVNASESEQKKPPQAADGRRKQWSLQDFEVGPSKGEGECGRVFVVRTKEELMGVGKMVFAMKRLDLRRISARLLQRELDVHRSLRHPHIVRFVTYFTDASYAYVIMEYCALGSVWQRMLRHGRSGFPENVSARYTAQLAEAVHYMHTRDPPVLHRDIKPENTLLDLDGNIKLADFGQSAMLRRSGRRTVCGTPVYTPPEMCENREYDQAVDAWCIGVFLYEMLYGKPPFEVEDGDDVRRVIGSAELKFPDKPVNAGAKDLLRRLIEKDTQKRMKVPQIFSHPWILERYYTAAGRSPPTLQTA